MKIETESQTLTIQRVYSLDMGKVKIRVKGTTEPLVINAKKIEENEDTHELLIYDYKDKVIGKFNQQEVVGWWVERD
jgi:hypothetical protein